MIICLCIIESMPPVESPPNSIRTMNLEGKLYLFKLFLYKPNYCILIFTGTVDEHFSTISLSSTNYNHCFPSNVNTNDNDRSPPTLTNTSMKLTKINGNSEFNNHKFYDFSSFSTMSGLMASCFKPMFDNFFYSAKTE